MPTLGTVETNFMDGKMSSGIILLSFDHRSIVTKTSLSLLKLHLHAHIQMPLEMYYLVNACDSTSCQWLDLSSTRNNVRRNNKEGSSENSRKCKSQTHIHIQKCKEFPRAIDIIQLKIKLNLWLTAPKGATPVKWLADDSRMG